MSTKVLTLLKTLGNSQSEKLYELMAQFTGATYKTVLRWVAGENSPEGLFYIKAMFFLELLGCKIAELQYMKKVGSYDTAKALAYNLINLQEIAEGTGYPEHSAMRAMGGRAGISDEKKEKLAKLAASRAELLSTAVTLWKQRTVLKQCATVTPEFEPQGDEPKKKKEKKASLGQELQPEIIDTSKAKVIATLAALIKAALPLAELVLSDSFSSEDRAFLRRLCGGDGVFRLSNQLNRLCGETARNS
jgi:hypothetical protein